MCFQKLLWGVLEAQGLSCSHCCRSVHQRCYDKGVSVCTQARGWVQLLIVFNTIKGIALQDAGRGDKLT